MVFRIFVLMSILSGQLFALESPPPQTVFYLVRHGQTDWNVQGKVQGLADIPLNDTGRAEAVQLSEKIGEIIFDVCFSSELTRALETAEILNATRPLIIKTDPALIERNFGPWEGQLFSELLEFEALGQPLLNIESDEEIQKRAFPLLHEIADSYAGSTVLIVTHGSVIRSLLTYLLDGNWRPIQSVQVKNMAILQLSFVDGQFNILKMEGIQFYNKLEATFYPHLAGAK